MSEEELEMFVTRYLDEKHEETKSENMEK